MATIDNGDITLMLFDDEECSKEPVFKQTFNGNDVGPYTVPFNKYDPNRLHLVSAYQPFDVSTVMVMQFYPLSENTCEGDAPIMKFFLNGTVFNSTDPYSQVYCQDGVAMNKICFNDKCELIPYPTNCTQYFNSYIYSNFICREGSPVPEDPNIKYTRGFAAFINSQKHTTEDPNLKYTREFADFINSRKQQQQEDNK